MMLRWVLQIDGVAFTLIGVIVLLTPSPQPALTDPVDPKSIGPFIDTRRLLATQFFAIGLLALVVGMLVNDITTLRLAGAARVLTLATVIAVNIGQLRGGAWRKGPLQALISTFTVLGLIYIIGIAVS